MARVCWSRSCGRPWTSPATAPAAALCGKCLVRLGAGELTPPTDRELKRISEKLRADGWRLACQARPVSARVSIEVRATGGRRRILTASKLGHGAAHPGVHLQPVVMTAPTLSRRPLDEARFIEALAAQQAADRRRRRAAGRAPASARDAARRQVARRGGALRPSRGGRVPRRPDAGPVRRRRGRRHLQDHRLPVRPGPRHPGRSGGHGEPADALRRRCDQPHRADGEAGRGRRPAAAVGGHQHHPGGAVRAPGHRAAPHLRRHGGGQHGHAPPGPGHLARGPGRGALRAGDGRAVSLRAAELGLEVNPEAGVHFPPPIAGFVARTPWPSSPPRAWRASASRSLAIDIGTNTEISLAQDGRVTVTSCASGPAFEGYQIMHGMKAVAGAIEHVRIAAAARPDIADHRRGAACGHLRLGRGRPARRPRAGRRRRPQRPHAGAPAVRQGAEGREYLVTGGPNGDIVFTQHDVRALQLAKGAIAQAGSCSRALGIASTTSTACTSPAPSATISTCRRRSSWVCSRRCARERVAFVGNAAGVGAQMALIDVGARRSMARLRARIEFLDLATDSEFPGCLRRPSRLRRALTGGFAATPRSPRRRSSGHVRGAAAAFHHAGRHTTGAAHGPGRHRAGRAVPGHRGAGGGAPLRAAPPAVSSSASWSPQRCCASSSPSA